MPRFSVLTIPETILQANVSKQQDIPLLSLPNEVIPGVFKASSILDNIKLSLTCKSLASFAAFPGILNLSTTSRCDLDLIRHDGFLPLGMEQWTGDEDRETGVWTESEPLFHFFGRAAKWMVHQRPVATN